MSSVDRIRSLLERNELNHERVAYSAGLGNVDATLVSQETPIVPEHFRSCVEDGLRLVSEWEAINFGVECVERVIDLWIEKFPQDQRPPKALFGAKNWLKNETGDYDKLITIAQDADDAGFEIDDPEKVPGDVSLSSAIDVASAASHVAIATAYATKGVEKRELGHDSVPNSISCACKFAADASAAKLDEQKWQLNQLGKVLVKQV